MKEFVQGLFVSRRDNAPDFVKANLSFKVEQFTEYLKSKVNEKGYVNIDIKESKDGRLYADLNDWKPRTDNEELPSGHAEEYPDIETPENIPF